MEDYDVFTEMQDLDKKNVIMLVEDDEEFVNSLLDDYEVIPLRLTYDLSSFSKEYIDKTKNLFAYYYTKENSIKNETLRMKKHFVHYGRFPKNAYLPSNDNYSSLEQILNSLNIECYHDKNEFLTNISKPIKIKNKD